MVKNNYAIFREKRQSYKTVEHGQTLKPDLLGAISGSTTEELCDHVKVTSSLFT